MRKVQQNSNHMEAMCEMLVDELKEELCRVTCNSQDECFLEVEDTQKQIEEEFDVEDRDEFYEGLERFIQVREIVKAIKKKAKDSKVHAGTYGKQ